MRSAVLALVVTLLAAPLPATAQHSPNADHDASTDTIPTEPGSATFAALAEIVAILSDDPETDWSRVDLEGLRLHLIDMDMLVKGASVIQTATPDGLRMRISRAGRAGEAAARMVPAHAAMLDSETGWSSVVDAEEGHLIWTVTGNADALKIQTLGFFGLMATGAHHQTHHLLLARGNKTR